jgi:predicted outer membrane repeat protein
VVIRQTSIDRVMELHGAGAPTVLRNVHLQGGRAVNVGGAVHVSNARLAVIDSVFSGNVATSAGGAIAARGPDASTTTALSIVGSRFEGNSAPEGGAVGLLASINAACSTVVDDSQFIDNRATSLGGAIAVSQSLAVGSSLLVRGSLFDGNSVSGPIGAGGAVGLGSSSPVDARIEDSDFLDNRADGAGGRGGAGFNLAQIATSRFSGNSAGRGGAVAGFDSTIEDSQFCDNMASLEGGAYYATLATVRRSTFCRNLAAQSGGALRLIAYEQGNVTIERSTFDGNEAPSGGAIAMDDGELRVLQSTLATLDTPLQSVGTLLRYDGPDDAAAGSSVELTGNLLRGSCSFASGIGVVNAANHNAGSGGDSCGLTQSGAAFSNNITYVQLASIPLLPLADNGGPTWTRMPTAVSNHPARGRVPAAQCIDPDQRRYSSTDATCDAGAVEIDGAPLPGAVFADGFDG